MLPAVILGALYWYERKERRELQEAKDALVERMMTTLSQNTIVLSEWRRMLGG